MHRGQKPATPFPLTCRACTARLYGLCRPLSGADLERARTFKSGDRTLRAGTHLYYEGDRRGEVYNLRHGWVALYQLLPDGRRQILDFALPGAVLGYQPELSDPLMHSAVCVTDAVVCVFLHERLLRLFQADPELAVRMTKICARDRLTAFEHLTNIGRRSARERVAFFLFEAYCRLRLRQLERDRAVDLPLTQEEIGDALGLTAVHVNRTLRRLREEGLVELHHHRLTVPEPRALAEAAGLAFDAPEQLAASTA